MKKNLTKVIITLVATFTIFSLFTSCPPNPDPGKKDDPSAIVEPQPPVYLLLLEQEGGTSKALYYNRDTGKWYKNYENGNVVSGSEYKETEQLSIPKRTVKVSFDIPYRNGSKAFDYPDLEGETPLNGYYLNSSDETPVVNKNGRLDSTYFNEGISKRTVIRAKFDEATIDLAGLNESVNAYIKSLGKSEEVAYWSAEGDEEKHTSEFKTLKNSKITLTTTSLSPRLDFNLKDNTYESATKSIYYNSENGKWYLDLTFENPVSSVVPPKKEWKVSFKVNPNGLEALLNQKNPDTQTSKFEFNGYKDGTSTVVDKDGLINESYGISEIKTLEPEFAQSGTVINLNTSYKKDSTIVKGYKFKGWTKSLESGDVIAEEENYVPESKEETLYAVWEPVVYELNFVSDTDTGVTFVGDSKIYYWQDHGWYKSHENLSESSTKIDKIEVPVKEWTVLVDDLYDGKVVDSVIQNSSTTYKGLQKDEVNKKYVYKMQWLFNGYSVSNQKIIDKDGNIIGERIVKDEVVDTEPSPWVEEGGVNSRLLLPKKSDMNDMASTKLKISRTFATWYVDNGKESINLDTDRLAPENNYLYSGSDKSDKPEIRIKATWQKGNEGELRLQLGESTEFEPLNIYSEFNQETQQGAWYKNIERTEKITSIESLPIKKWTVFFDYQNGGENDSKDYDFDFKGFIKDGITYINEKGEIKAAALKTITPIEVTPTFEPSSAYGVDLPRSITKQGYELLGWSKDKSAKIPDENLNVNRFYFKPEENNITLYAIWSPVVNRIDLNANATNKAQMTKILYSRYNDEGKIKFYFDEKCTKEYNSSEFISPERNYTISFTNPEYIDINVPDILVNYKFNGYKIVSSASDGSSTYFMDANKEISDEIYNKNESVQLNLEASLTEVESEVVLPSPDDSKVVGYKFLYWSKTPDGEEFVQPDEYSSNISLYGIWEREVFTLSLDFGEYSTSTEEATENLYYLYGDAWYKERDENGKVVKSSKVTPQNSIILPKKTLVVKFDKNTNEEVIASPENLLSNEFNLEFQFDSYRDESRVSYITQKGSSIEIVNKIEKDVNATVVWSPFPHLDIKDFSVKIDSGNPDKSFIGWGLEQDNPEEVISTNQYTPDETVGQEVTLYAKWKDPSLFTLFLDDNGATTKGQSSIFYRQGVDGKNGTWYADASGEEPLLNNTLTSLPKKEWKVTFEYVDENGANKTETTTSNFTFEGYVKTGDDSGSVQIYSDGKIQDNSYITNDVTLVARWSDKPSGVRLSTPLDERNGYVFKGWSLTPQGSVIGKDEYIPESDDVILYAIYESEVYSLYLFNVVNVDDESASLYRRLYYQYDVGWFNDESCTDPVVNIALPKSTFFVDFTVGDHNVATPQTKEVTRKFDGYYFKNNNGSYDDTKVVVDNTGLLVLDRITEDSRVFSKWSAQDVNLPQGLNDPGWDFNGWVDGGGNLYRDKFKPEETTSLTAQWQPKTYTITLVHNATDESDAPKRIVYKTGSGWFDEDGKQLERINVPKREYEVNLVTINNDPVSAEPRMSSFSLVGYYNTGDDRPYIKADGELNKDITDIREDKIISAKWTQQQSQKLSIPNRLTYNREGWDFIGWSEIENSGALIDTNNYQPIARSTTLYAIYEPFRRTLTFEVLDKSHLTNESSYTKTVYCDYDKGWFEDSAYTTKLTRIRRLPERSITIKIEKNDPTVDVSQQTQLVLKSTFPFLGYADKNGSDKFFDENGYIVNSQKRILTDTTVYAMFNLQSDVKLPTDSDPSENQEVFVAEGGGQTFTGLESADGEIVLSPGATYRPQDDITLVATWRANTNRITLTKDPDDGKPEYSRDIYYKTNRTGYEWYSDSSCTNKLSVLNSEILPSRSYTISYDINTTEEGIEQPEDSKYEFKFDGFSVPYNNTDVKIIDENGVLKTAYSDIPRGALNNDVTAIATWKDPTDPITLPTLRGSTTDFMGWNESGEPDTTVNAGTLRPEEDRSLKAVWGYLQKTLTLNSPDATEHGDTQVFYVTSSNGTKDKGWYRNPSDSDKIVSINVPKKAYKVTLDYDHDNKTHPIDYEYDFLGYYDTQEYQWVTGYKGETNGALSDDKELTEDLSAEAWFNDGKHNSTDVKAPINLNQDYSLNSDKREGYKAVGWSKTKGNKQDIIDEYRPQGNDTLYAVWDGNVYSATLNSNGADNDEDLVKKLYYKVGDGWYGNGDSETGVVSDEIPYLSVIPKKEYVVNLHPGMNYSDVSYTSSFGFEGYFLANRMIIRPSGVIVSTLSSGENVVTLNAQWTESPSSIPLKYDSYTREGYEFVGWSTKEDASVNEAIVTATYTPKENNETLYGIWKPNVYKLSLSSPDKRNSVNSQFNDTPTEALYYKVDDGWYYDEEATSENAFSGKVVRLPIKEWDVFLLGGGFGGLTRKEEVSSFPFNGYYYNNEQIISSDGTLKTEYTISADTELVARWGDQTSIELPLLSQTGYTFYGWSEQNTGKDNVIRATDYFPRREETYLYAISNSDVFMLNLTADDGNGTVESTEQAIYYRAFGGDDNVGGWYLDPNGSGEKITRITPPTSYCTVSYDEIYIEGLPVKVESKKINRQFKGFSVNGETYIDSEGNIIKDSITSSYNANAVWSEYDEIESLYDADTDKMLKVPYLVFKEWREKESGNVVTSPYKPTHDITIVPTYRRSYIDVVFEPTTNTNYSDYNFDTELDYDRLWIDVQDGLWYMPYGEGQVLPQKGSPITKNSAKFKLSSYSIRIADPYTSEWSTDTTNNNWKGYPENLTKDLTSFYTDYDSDSVDIQIDIPGIKGMGYTVDKTTLVLFSDENFNLLNYSIIKEKNPQIEFETENGATYRVCVLYSSEGDDSTKSVEFPTSDDNKTIRNFEYANRPSCVVFNTRSPQNRADRILFQRDYNAYCEQYSNYDRYYYIGSGLRIIEMEITHANLPNVIYSITRDSSTLDFNKEDGNSIVFDHTDNNSNLTHYLLPYRYGFGEYLAADTTLSDITNTSYSIQRVNVRPSSGTYVSSTTGMDSRGNNNVFVTLPDGSSMALKDVTIIPYVRNNS